MALLDAQSPNNTKDRSHAAWDYREAFSRNRGLISDEEQQVLRTKRVAILGMGGIGGINLATLSRLGIGKFTIADPDVFELANFNRQYGATVSNLGRGKAQTMAAIARDINPELDLRVITTPIGAHNAAEFISDADLFVDSVEFFAMEVRRTLFKAAADKGIFGITAGPVGFSGIWIAFDPSGMSFDRYFDLADDMPLFDQLIAFAVGVAPKATQRGYMDLRQVDTAARVAPSSVLACNIAAAAVACESIKLLLHRMPVKSAPFYNQFDPYRGVYKCGQVRGGNRHPMQRIKRWVLARRLKSLQHA
jgi:molybdopterin/thiamine biosynthesis adenylyltransferase